MSQFSRKIGWKVVLIAVGNTKLWRDCVSNKEIADEKEKKGCARAENLWEKRERSFVVAPNVLLKTCLCFFLGLSSYT